MGVIRYPFSIGRASGAPSLDPWERKTRLLSEVNKKLSY